MKKTVSTTAWAVKLVGRPKILSHMGKIDPKVRRKTNQPIYLSREEFNSYVYSSIDKAKIFNSKSDAFCLPYERAVKIEVSIKEI